MQLSVNCDQSETLPASLMELGFVPGTQITAGRSAPGGDPQVFQVDGSEIALRRETARRLTVRRQKIAKPGQAPRA